MRLRLPLLLTALAAVSALAGLTACSNDDDRIELPPSTTLNLSPEEEAKLALCDAFEAFVAAENRRFDAATSDEDLIVRIEERRVTAIDTLAELAPDGTPAAVTEALETLRGIPITPIELPDSPDGTVAAPPTTEDRFSAPTKVVTDHFAPTCGGSDGSGQSGEGTTASTAAEGSGTTS